MTSGKSISASTAGTPPRKHVVCTSVTIAAIANALIPAVFFSAAGLFGQTDARYRTAVAAMVLLQYAVVFLLLLFHANAPFASGYSVATSAIVTLVSMALTYATLAPAGWGWSRRNTEFLVVAGIAFAVLSNVWFLIASIRYARAVHPRLHLGGFFLGIAASLVLLFLYVKILG
jgi:hypothetical protein